MFYYTVIVKQIIPDNKEAEMAIIVIITVIGATILVERFSTQHTKREVEYEDMLIGG